MLKYLLPTAMSKNQYATLDLESPDFGPVSVATATQSQIRTPSAKMVGANEAVLVVQRKLAWPLMEAVQKNWSTCDPLTLDGRLDENDWFVLELVSNNSAALRALVAGKSLLRGLLACLSPRVERCSTLVVCGTQDQVAETCEVLHGCELQSVKGTLEAMEFVLGHVGEAVELVEDVHGDLMKLSSADMRSCYSPNLRLTVIKSEAVLDSEIASEAADALLNRLPPWPW